MLSLLTHSLEIGSAVLALPLSSIKEKIFPLENSINQQLSHWYTELWIQRSSSSMLQILGQCFSACENLSPCQLLWCSEKDLSPQLEHRRESQTPPVTPPAKKSISNFQLVQLRARASNLSNQPLLQHLLWILWSANISLDSVQWMLVSASDLWTHLWGEMSHCWALEQCVLSHPPPLLKDEVFNQRIDIGSGSQENIFQWDMERKGEGGGRIQQL